MRKITEGMIILALVWEVGIYCTRGCVDLLRSMDSSSLTVAGRNIMWVQVLIGSIWELVAVYFWSKYEAGGVGGLRIEHEFWNNIYKCCLSEPGKYSMIARQLWGPSRSSWSYIRSEIKSACFSPAWINRPGQLLKMLMFFHAKCHALVI